MISSKRYFSQIGLFVGALVVLQSPVATATAAGVVSGRTPSITGGDFDNDGLIDTAYGFSRTPCGADSWAKLCVLLDAESTSIDASPPSVSLNLSSAPRLCGDDFTLAATTNEPGSDIVEARWFVDGVLLDAILSDVMISEARTIRAETEDSRGAVRSALQEVECQ